MTTAKRHRLWIGLILIAVRPCVASAEDGPSASALFRVIEEGKFGFIDKTGKIVIEPRFRWAGDFSERRACVWKDGKCGYIDEAGTVKIEPSFQDAGPFSEGLAHVKIKGKRGSAYGYIDRDGKTIIPPKFADAASFSCGLARVSGGVLRSSRGNAYIDKTGKVVVQRGARWVGKRKKYWSDWAAYSDFSDGLVHIRSALYSGYMDTTGKTVIQQKTWPVGRLDFAEGLAAVRAPGSDQWGFMDKQGEYVIKPQFAWASRFSEGLAGVDVSTNKHFKSMGRQWGYIDKTGKIVIEPKYHQVFGFSEGLARVRIDDSWSFVDKKGKALIEMKDVDMAYDFRGGLARVEIDGKWGYIDRKGTYVWMPKK